MTLEQCYHICRICGCDWAHGVPTGSELDPYYLPCPDCSAEIVAVPVAQDEVAQAVLQEPEPSEPPQRLEPSDDIAVTVEDEEDDARIARTFEAVHLVVSSAEEFDE